MNATGNPVNSPFYLRFWGVRGSFPTASPQQLGIGGNTACVQLIDGSKDFFILDAGPGIRELGKSIMALDEPPPSIHILFTHFHWDHLQGLPYFLPLYSPNSNIIFHSAHPPDELRAVLAAQMDYPYFPVLFHQLPAHMEFRHMGLVPHRVGSVTIENFPLHHPQTSVGFRIVHPQRVAVYATDHEHGEPVSAELLRERSQNADILIYDGQYTPKEYESRRGWGHSTWREGVHIATGAHVKQLVLFHHDPDRDDEAVRRIEHEARKEFPATIAAYEGLIL
jgi:phosphoribosyl 1,2-cyclic phosphodiesterase